MIWKAVRETVAPSRRLQRPVVNAGTTLALFAREQVDKLQEVIRMMIHKLFVHAQKGPLTDPAADRLDEITFTQERLENMFGTKIIQSIDIISPSVV